MKKTVFHIIWGAVSALQTALIAGAVVLSRLAFTRGGVNHHIAYRKRQYNALVFTPGKVLLMQAALVLLAVLLVWLLLRAIRQRKKAPIVLRGFCILLDIVLLLELTLPTLRSMLIYPYVVLITTIIYALELMLAALQTAVQT